VARPVTEDAKSDNGDKMKKRGHMEPKTANTQPKKMTKKE